MARGNFKPRSEAQLAAMRKGKERQAELVAAAAEARVQDLEWMASTGETTEGAAERLAISTDALWKWVDARGRRDLWEKLRSNEVARFGVTLGELRRVERANAEKGRPRRSRSAA